MTIIVTVFKALARAIFDRVIAGHQAGRMSANFHGIDPKKREFLIGGFGPLGGGGTAPLTTAHPRQNGRSTCRGADEGPSL